MSDDTRYAYAVARVRGMETRLLDRQWVERLLSEDGEGALKVLGDSDFQEHLSEVQRPEDIEKGLVGALASTLSTLSDVSPEPALMDLFRVRQDVRNLKSLLKRSLLKLEAEDIGLVDGVGLLPVGVLEKAVQDHDYISLPSFMADAATRAEETFRDRGELADVDGTLERALWAHQLEVAEDYGNEFLVGYLRAEIDLMNIRTAVRIKARGGERDDVAAAFVPGGTLDRSFFETAVSEPLDALARALEYGAYGELAEVLREWSQDRFYSLDLACDNILLATTESARTTAYGIEPLVAFVLRRRLEIKLIRAAVVAKLDGLVRAAVEERLRSIHV